MRPETLSHNPTKAHLPLHLLPASLRPLPLPLRSLPVNGQGVQLYHAWMLHYVKRLDVYNRPEPHPDNGASNQVAEDSDWESVSSKL